VRPTKLTIQGLTAYKQQVEVDFTDLDLFAITGPTGAGKSSLVDAITFALFGKAPRVGRDIKELISQGEERLKVSLEFATNGDHWRIYRSTARKGAAPVQLERFDKASNEWMPEEDRVKEANAAIERVLQMDYEAFVRSVLLPQGQFQEFLAGDRDQRRKVLDGLLQLNVYAAMQQRANAIDRDKTAEADAHRRRLDNELADATPEALKSAKSQLKELKVRATDLAKLREATDAACRTADALSNALRLEREARQKLDGANKALGSAQDLLDRGNLLLAGMDAQIGKVADEMQAAEYDGDAHLRLVKCLPLLRQIEDAATRDAKLAREIETHTRSVEKARAEVDAAKMKQQSAQTEAQAKHDEYEAARHTNATALLRQKLKKGDPCPVCGQAAPELPKVQAVVLDKLKAAYDKAKADETRANEGVAAAEKRLAVEETGTKSAAKQLLELRAQAATLAKELAAVIDEPGLQAGVVEKRITALETAKTQRASLEEKQRALTTERQNEEKRIGEARTNVALLATQVLTHAGEAARAAKDALAASIALSDAAKQMEWRDVTIALEGGRDVAALLRNRLVAIQDDVGTVDRQIGAEENQIKHIEKAIGDAKVLREQEKACREEATLARDLASLLQVNRFPAFLRERAMGVLAEAGSAQLRQVSGGRYDLIADGQDFAVEDLWNASEPRPVRTLSGGETFLASLALALALAEHLPALAGNGHHNTLESLFIDEGFSHLDSETLDTVASALEVLGQDRRRLIGVVTHVPALADRMPARITVHKSQGGSTVSVE
jgi:exonuclease SbcC